MVVDGAADIEEGRMVGDEAGGAVGKPEDDVDDAIQVKDVENGFWSELEIP